jgi:hypothetical protein
MKTTGLGRFDKDRAGGVLLVLLGLGVTVKGSGYPLGTVGHMGAGFMPVVYGSLIALVGLALVAASFKRKLGAEVATAGAAGEIPPIDWRAPACILGGVAAFVLVGGACGLAPATFAAVFIAALGDRENSPRAAALLALALVAVATLVFSYGLGLEMPLVKWP